MADLWTAEDVELVANAMVYRTRGALLTSDAVALAEAVLAALAEAGWLASVDAEKRTEWGVWWHADDDDSDSRPQRQDQGGMA